MEKMEHSEDEYKPKNRGGRVLAGMIVVFVGIVFLLRQVGYFFPEWLFTWPMILIAIGVYSGAQHSFRSRGWLIIVGIGLIFLAPDIMPGINLWRYTVPAIIIFVGIMIILGSNRKKWKKDSWFRNEYNDQWKENYKDKWKDSWKGYASQGINSTEGTPSHDDYIDIVSIFGGVHKQIVSKTFRGGDVVNIFGGSELNFMQADIQGNVYLETTQVFGGAKIIVPRHWKVVSNVNAIFGGTDDKRMIQNTEQDPNKVLIIEGVSIFGGLEIICY